MANASALNTSDESQIRRRRLPLELQCELIFALPLDHASRLLLLSDGINNNCIARVRKLHEKWQEFSDRRVNELVKRYHPWLPGVMSMIEEAHLKLDNLAAEQKAILTEKMRLSHVRDKLSPWVGENAVRRATGAVTRHKVMTELLNSIAHIRGFIEINNKWFKNADKEHKDLDRSVVDIMGRLKNDRSKLVTPQFSKEILSAAGSERSAERLRRDYFAHLDATHARLIELPRVHREKLMQSGVRKLMHEWSGEVQKHYDIIIAQWKAINVQNADEFNATVWRERFLDELKANNALNVENPDGDGVKCQCLLGGARVSGDCPP